MDDPECDYFHGHDYVVGDVYLDVLWYHGECNAGEFGLYNVGFALYFGVIVVVVAIGIEVSAFFSGGIILFIFQHFLVPDHCHHQSTF